MATSFHVNVHDLSFILKQIQVSELQASTPGMTTVEAIQAVYGVSAADAALMPVGLRTVDGSDNSLLPGTESNGAGDTPFPRLLDPVYSNEGDENPFFGISNTNYGNSGNVVDSDPRTISNLIVDQTPANVAAIYAALKAVGTTGVDANTAVAAITVAYQATLNAKGADAAVEAAETALSAETADHGAAVAAFNAAELRVAHFTSAGPLAEVAAEAADAASDALTVLVADVEGGNDVTGSLATALAAAVTAKEAADAVTTALGGDAVPAAQALADAAQHLLEFLDTAAQSLPIDEAALVEAVEAFGAVLGSDGHAADSVGAIQAGLASAEDQADAAATVRDAAQADLAEAWANFIAAYGNHASITSATTLADKREAATLLLFGDGTNSDGVTIRGVTYTNEDRLNFLNGRGGYGAGNDRGGLDNVDLWIGGLAEKVTEFGGMLGTTFGFIFEYQMEQLQNGDRFYYLSRTQGLNLLDALEANTFADIVMRNSALSGDYATHINANLFLTPDMILELDRAIAQRDYNGAGAGRDPVWDDPIIQSLDPKVIRVDSGVTDANGHQVGGELHFRGGEHVVLGGTEGDDYIKSDLGDDALWGDGGNDYLNGGAGADQVFGGDGDDIIEDTFGDNFLRGERGNDVVSSSRGINLLFGGEGRDALLVGQDAGEAFGGEGNDFILGGSGGDNLLGNEGNDWIEGGEGFDVISGDNSELFFNSTVIGHDVAWGQGNDQDYDLESGDDIALSGIGVQRFEGMFGFDWASAKYDVAGVNWDFNIPIFTSAPADILRDRFDLMEGMSGWIHNDTLLGDNRGGTVGDTNAAGSFEDHVLTAAGIDRINGLRNWFDGALETLGGPGATSFRDGNLIMGGAGSDRMMGRGGFDVIDGDAWLNVRIRIVVDGTVYSAESLNSSQAAAGPYAGRVYAMGADGRPDFSAPAFGGRSLTSLLLDRTINPGDMSIVREIVTAAPGTARDRAVFAGALDEY